MQLLTGTESSIIRFIVTTNLQVLLWIAVVVAGFLGVEWFKRPPVIRGDFSSLRRYLTLQLDEATARKRVGSAALILINNGSVAGEYVYGAAGENGESPPRKQEMLYLLCSVSKAVTAWGVMKLVEDQKIGLDEPILPHLTRWKFPGSEAYREEVTIRHLLSHTSGLVDGFGYSGFSLEEVRQTPEESLNFPKDANMGDPHPAIINNKPGTVLSYSSAGYTVLQILIEELTGKSFNQYMIEEIFHPLGLTNATFDTEQLVLERRLSQLAPNFDEHLNVHPPRKHTMMAGGSLRITAHEMGLFLQAYFTQSILSAQTIDRMLQPQPGTSFSWGLGHEIYILGQHKIVGHGGGAFPRTGASFRIDPASGNGIALMMTGGTESIDPYMKAWTYWETGIHEFDIREVVHSHGMRAFVVSVIGGIAIVGWRIRSRQSKVNG